MQFHDKRNRQELKYVSKKSKRYVFLPAIPNNDNSNNNELLFLLFDGL